MTKRKPVRNREPCLCYSCGARKSLTEFYQNTRAASGYQWKCKVCIAAYNRELHLRTTYGMSLKDYDNMLASQNHACAICYSKSTKRKHQREFHVDHDHKTGEVRAILCGNCNAALGYLEEDPDRMRRMADYVDSY